MRRLALILLATLVIYVVTGLVMGLLVTQGIFAGLSNIPGQTGIFAGLSNIPGQTGIFAGLSNIPGQTGIFAGLSNIPGQTGGFTGSFWGDVQGLLGVMFQVGELPDKPPIVLFIIILAVAFLQACLVFLPLPLDLAGSVQGGRLRPRIFAAALLIPLPFVLAGLWLSDALYFLPGSAKDVEEIAMMSTVGCLVAWGVSWLVWIPLLLRRSKGEPDAVERAVARALRGTAIGWALSLPWHYVVRERQTCVCATGTFLGLIFGLIGLVLVGGPLLLVFARDRRIRAALRSE